MREIAAFASSADAAAMQKICGPLLGSLLLPAVARGYVEDADVTVCQKLEWSLNFVHAVELRRALSAEAFEPDGIDEVGEQNVVDLIAKAVVLAGVTDFIGVERACGVGVLNEYGEVDVGVAKHFQKLVTGGDRPGCAGLQIARCEYLAHGHAVGCEIVIAESIGLVGVVEQYE